MAASLSVLAQNASGRPHIVLLVVDQHKGGYLGVAGNHCGPETAPDLLARQGVMFRNPIRRRPRARRDLLTGMSPWGHGLLGYGHEAERYAVELPQLLRDAGCYTAGIGKMLA